MRIYVTFRQKQILEYLQQKKTQKEIAVLLNCTSANVSQTIKTIQRRYPQLKVWKQRVAKEEFELDGVN